MENNLDLERDVLDCIVERLIYFLYEESYLTDKEIINDYDLYKVLFLKLYYILDAKHVSNYLAIIKSYIAMCVNDNEVINYNNLLSKLSYFSKQNDRIMSDDEVEQVQKQLQKVS